MPRLGRTAFLRREYRRTLDPDKRPRETAQEAEARRRQAAREAARGSV